MEEKKKIGERPLGLDRLKKGMRYKMCRLIVRIYPQSSFDGSDKRSLLEFIAATEDSLRKRPEGRKRIILTRTTEARQVKNTLRWHGLRGRKIASLA